MKILLADDSTTAQMMASKILKEAGFHVTTVSNGVQALNQIATTSPDLVILDIHMPGYTGLEVCERIRASIGTRHIPVLLAVGKMEPFSPEDSARVMADGIIVKPFEATDLIATVNNLIEMRAPVREAMPLGATAVEAAPPLPASAAPAREPEIDLSVSQHERRLWQALDVMAVPEEPTAAPLKPTNGTGGGGSVFDQFVPSAAVAKAAEAAQAVDDPVARRMETALAPKEAAPALQAAAMDVKVISEVVSRVLAQMLPEILKRITQELEMERGKQVK